MLESINGMPIDDRIEKDTVVLMITCKKYEQVWKPFIILFKKYWPDCPYKFIMGTDFGSYDGIEVLEIGKDLGWSNNCIYLLKQVDAKRIILFF